MNSCQEWLKNDKRFYQEEGLFYQKDFPRHNSFEESYLKLRQKEGRVYSDEVVRLLPEFQGSGALATEWKIRKRSTQRLIHYLQRKRPARILEIGCGNGWLLRYLHQHVAPECCGIDINEQELQQAVRISGTASSTCFLYGDILSGFINEWRADIIIVASAAQYFPHLNHFIDRLTPLLTPHGEIHIIDTPFYHEGEIENAKRRSEKYFTDAGIDAKQRHYYHHTWNSLEPVNYKIVYQPTNFFNKMKKLFIQDSPFPWIVISKKDNNG